MERLERVANHNTLEYVIRVINQLPDGRVMHFMSPMNSLWGEMKIIGAGSLPKDDRYRFSEITLYDDQGKLVSRSYGTH